MAGSGSGAHGAYADVQKGPAGVRRLEDRLLVRAVRCHAYSFGAIVDRYYDPIRALIERICGRDEADDLARETFLKAFCSFDTFEFRGEDSLRTWLHRIAVNTAINALRSRKRRRGFEGPSLDENIDTEDGTIPRCIPDVSTEPGRVAELAEIRRVVWEAIQSLSPKNRQALVLIDIQKLEYSEASSLIGCRMGTLKSRLSRARDALAAKIGQRKISSSAAPQPRAGV